MASDSLSNHPSKLNLSRRQTVLFQKIIIAGKQMAEAQWSGLMLQLAKALL